MPSDPSSVHSCSSIIQVMVGRPAPIHIWRFDSATGVFLKVGQLLAIHIILSAFRHCASALQGVGCRIRRQKQLAPGASEKSNGGLQQVSESKVNFIESDSQAKLTPNMAMLRATAAFSDEVRVPYAEAKKPLGARRDEGFSTRTLLGAGILYGLGLMRRRVKSFYVDQNGE